MKDWLWLLFCSIILPSGVTSFAASSFRGHLQGRSGSIIRHKPLFLSHDENVWVPPSQQLLETKSTIFKIQNPEDFLHFISEDDRLCVIKVYASWCQACKKFDLRYRKLASKFGDKYATANGAPTIKQKAGVRFAEIQYDNAQNQNLCDDLLGVNNFPYILIYKRQKGKIRGFHCTPAKFQILVDTVEELLKDDEENVGIDDSFQKQVIDLGLADGR